MILAKIKFETIMPPNTKGGKKNPITFKHSNLEKDLKILIDKKQIINLDQWFDENLVVITLQIVITVQQDKSIKIALDSKMLNDAIHKNKYQKQIIDYLLNTVTCKISETKQN